VCGVIARVREKLTQIAGSVAVHSGVCELNDVLVSTPRSLDHTHTDTVEFIQTFSRSLPAVLALLLYQVIHTDTYNLFISYVYYLQYAQIHVSSI